MNDPLSAPPHPTKKKTFVFTCVNGNSVGKARSYCLATNGNPLKTSVPCDSMACGCIGRQSPHSMGTEPHVLTQLLVHLG